MKFLYVFNESDRDFLIKNGYTEIKSDKAKNIYIFDNKSNMHFQLHEDNPEIEFVATDMMTL